MSRLSYLYGTIRDLEVAALEDLGGEASVGILRREVLSLGLHSESIAVALLEEICSKMRQSREEGRVPCPSRYKATAVIGHFLALAGRQFCAVGLARVPRDVTTLDTYLADRRRAAGKVRGGAA